MKKTILILSFIPFLFSCNSNNTGSADIAKAKQAVLDSMNQVNLITQQQREIDSLEALANKPTVAAKQYGNTPNTYSSSSNSVPSTPVSYSAAKKKRKMSNVAKGALIGAGVGAITGAVVSKKSGKGAIIGGVIGAGAGAGTGAIIDKKKKQKESTIYF